MRSRVAVLLGLVSVVSQAAVVKVSPEAARAQTGLALVDATTDDDPHRRMSRSIEGTLTEPGCVKADGLCFPAETRLTLTDQQGVYRLSAVDRPVELDGVRWQRVLSSDPGVLTTGVLAECWPGPRHLAAGAEALGTCLPAGTTIGVRVDGGARRLAASSAPVTLDGFAWQVLDGRMNGYLRGQLARPRTEAGFTWTGQLSRESWPDSVVLRGTVAEGPLRSRWAGDVFARVAGGSWSAMGVLVTALHTSSGSVIGDVELEGTPVAPLLVKGFAAQPSNVAGYDVPAGALLRGSGPMMDITLHRDVHGDDLELVATRRSGHGPDRVLAIVSLPNGVVRVLSAGPMPYAGTTFARRSTVHLLNGEVRRVEGELLKPHLEPTLSASAGVSATATDGCFHFFSARSGGTLHVGARAASVAHRASDSPNACSTPWTPIFDDSRE